jgi:hypothetical protein
MRVKQVNAVPSKLPAEEGLPLEQATTGSVQEAPGRAWIWRVEDDRREWEFLPIEEPLGEHHRPHPLEGKERPVDERL